MKASREATMTQLNDVRSDVIRALVAVTAAFLVPILAWYAWYRIAGLTQLAVTVAQIAVADNWGRTAFGEELLFAGVICSLIVRVFASDGKRPRRWLAVPIVAILFALWHLPGYLAVGHTGGALIGRLGLNLASWLVFGTIYLLSGNLWLVVLAHSATDYGVTPLITNEPIFGLVFMATLVAGASRIGRGGESGSRRSRRCDAYRA